MKAVFEKNQNTFSKLRKMLGQMNKEWGEYNLGT